VEGSNVVSFITAVVLTDASGRRLRGVSLDERAALAAAAAGITRVHFAGETVPDPETCERLRSRGLAVSVSPGKGRPLAGARTDCDLLVLPAATLASSATIAALVRQASATPGSATLQVEVARPMKASLLLVTDGGVTSVVGDGNARSADLLLIPSAVVPRVQNVWAMVDIVHRLARHGLLRAVETPGFRRALLPREDPAAVEREHRLAEADGDRFRLGWQSESAAARLRSWSRMLWERFQPERTMWSALSAGLPR
jgi:hypothetical protein